MFKSTWWFCDNLTTSQFEATYKRLLLHKEILIVTSDSKNKETNYSEFACTAGNDIN